jgi:hypothetical protein
MIACLSLAGAQVVIMEQANNKHEEETRKW